LPAEISGVRKGILDVSLVKTRQMIEALLKTYELFMNEDMRYFTYFLQMRYK